MITKKIAEQDGTATHYLPISGINHHLNDFNKSKNLQNSLNANQKLRNNINITNNSTYEDNKFSFNKNLKSSKLRNFEEKEIIPSPIYRKDSNEKRNFQKPSNIPLEILNKIEENNSNNKLRNSQIQVKYVVQGKNANAFLKSSNSTNVFNLNNNPVNNFITNTINNNNNQLENLKKPFLEKKTSESIIEKEKRILGNFNKIEKLRNLELKDLDSLEMKTNETNSSNKTGSFVPKNFNNEEADLINKENETRRSSKANSANFTEKDKASNEVKSVTTLSNCTEDNKENAIKVPVNSFKENNKNSVSNNNPNLNLDKAEGNNLKNNEEIELNDSLEKSSSKDSNKENENPNTNKNLKFSQKKLTSNTNNNLQNETKTTSKVKNNNILEQKENTIISSSISNTPSIYKNNPQIPYDYLKEIHISLSQEELNIPSLFGYMKNHSDINEQMRAILVDWIIEVHSKFSLKEETLFLCVFIIDKFLKNEVIPRSKLQLLGVASIMIACKQEEIYSPSIKDFVFITDNAYTTQEIFEMEYHILKVLEFNTVMPSSLRFYELIALDFNFDLKQFNFGLYLLELYLIDYRMTKYLPSVIACTAAYIVMKFFKMPNYTKIYNCWNRNTNSSSLIKDCAREICFLVDNINGSSLKATKKKFTQDKYDAVSLINFF